MKAKAKAADTGPSIISSTIPSLPLPPPFFPPHPPASDLSTSDLKTLMLSRLLEETDSPTTEAIDLISVLRYPPPPRQTPDFASLPATIAEKDAQIAARDELIAARDETIRVLREQVAALEDTCRAQSQGHEEEV